MNRKLLVMLLLPMLLLPMAGFGYAHWTDKVTKQIKMHAGTVEVDIVQWHVDRCTSYDVNCNDEIFGDEFKVEVLTEDGQVVEILITADPVYPSWMLEFKFLVHNKGRLSIDSWEHRVDWEGPFDEDPTWLYEQPYPDNPEPPPCIEYVELLFLHNKTGWPDTKYDKRYYTVRVAPTTYMLKPSECVLVYEFIHFDCQEMQEEYSCKWFRLAKELVFKQHVGDEWSSEGWTKP